MEFFRNTNFDFFGKKWLYIIGSLVLILAGLISLAIKGGPRYGIDFRGGTLVYVKFASKPPIENLRKALGTEFPGSAPEVQEVTGTNEVIIGTDQRDEKELQQSREKILRTLERTFGTAGGAGGKLDVNNAQATAIADRLRSANLAGTPVDEVARVIVDFRNTPPRSGLLGSFDQLKGVTGVTPQVISTLKSEAVLSPYAIRQVEIVGPKMGDELRQQAGYVILSALGGMLIYIAFRFEWIYGVAAVLSVLHDTIITVGLFSLLDKEISLTVVAALLTLVGYSMNDKIVIFDRIRENLKIHRRMPLPELVNLSINETLSRTFLTGGLTFLSCVSLLAFGGPALHGFSFALVAGIIVGTYSSIFVASPILVFWKNFIDKRRRSATVAPAATAGSGARKPAATKVMK